MAKKEEKIRYQVFVSATFKDLKEERRRVIEELLNNEYFPASMEYFAASDMDQFEYIKKVIDDSDYYILILAGKYGTIEKRVELAIQKKSLITL